MEKDYIPTVVQSLHELKGYTHEKTMTVIEHVNEKYITHNDEYRAEVEIFTSTGHILITLIEIPNGIRIENDKQIGVNVRDVELLAPTDKQLIKRVLDMLNETITQRVENEYGIFEECGFKLFE